jgi:hypothetical protein
MIMQNCNIMVLTYIMYEQCVYFVVVRVVKHRDLKFYAVDSSLILVIFRVFH